MSDYLHRKSHTHQRAREALKRLGHKVNMKYVAEIVYAIEAETGRACTGDQTEFIRRWLGSIPVAKPRTPAPWKDLEIPPGLRANFARAAKDQPRLWTPGGGRGNGVEDSKVWRR